MANGVGTGSVAFALPNVVTAGSAVIASLTVDAKGRVTAYSSAATTGSGSVVLATSPTIVTPTIASLINANHTHQDAAGGGQLNASSVFSAGTLPAAQMPALTGDIATSAGAIATTLATVNSNVGSFAIATLTVNAKGLITAASAASTTGSGSVVLATSPAITTPTIASLANMQHNHQNAAGGGSLDAAAIGSGQLALARGGTSADLSATGAANSFLKQSSSGAAVTVGAILSADLTTALTTPPIIGGTMPAAITGTIITASTRFVGPILAPPVADSTTALKITKADGSTTVVNIDTTNSQVGIGLTPNPAAGYGLSVSNIAGAYFKATDGGSTVFEIEATSASYANSMLYMHTNTAAASTFNYLDFRSNSVQVLTVKGNGLLTITLRDAATAAVTDAAILDHGTSGTPAAGFGPGLLLKSQVTGTATHQNAAAIRTQMTNIALASYATQSDFVQYDFAATRTVLSIGANGSASVLAFFGGTPVIKQATTGTTTGFTAGAGTAVKDDSTFTGGSGATAYRLSDIVLALKNYGLLAA